MFKCIDCGCRFSVAAKVTENHGFSSPPYESYLICPNCKSNNFFAERSSHCIVCGAKTKGESLFCSAECKAREEKRYRAALLRRLEAANSPLSEIINELNSYNEINNTHYSYGQFVAIIKPRLKGKRK